MKALENEQNEESMNGAGAMQIETIPNTSKEVHGILVHWSLEEIRHYYSLMWQQSTKQVIDEGNDKAEQPTYICIEESATIEAKSR